MIERASSSILRCEAVGSVCMLQDAHTVVGFKGINTVSEMNELSAAHERQKREFSLSSVNWRLFIADYLYLASSKDGEVRQTKPSRAVHNHSANDILSYCISRNCFIGSTKALHSQFKIGYFNICVRDPLQSTVPNGTQVRGFKPGRSRRIFQGEKKSSARLPSEGK